ncbi:MAG: YkvI family membrane protein [Sphaerochaeta sp.]
MSKKEYMSVSFGVAFVWFTTQFGGGFASGAQLLVYFVDFGIWTLITPILAQLMGAFFQWYGLRYAYRHKTYDYRSFTDSFFGKYKIIFSNLYEFVYILLICLAPAVAFATGGATMHELLGIPYMLCTLIVGIAIFFLTIFGTDLVRKAASTISIIIIVGLLGVYIPNIIAQWSTISSNIGTLSAEKAPLWPAIKQCFLYGAFQLASIGLFMQHAKSFKNEKDAKTSMVYGFLINSFVILMCTIGMLAIVNNPELHNVSVPTLLLVKTGVGASVLTPVISLLIILGAISTAVNMIAGVVARYVNAWEKNEEPEVAKSKHKKRTIIVALIADVIAFSVAQFGLIPLVAKGYKYLGFITVIVIIIPFIIHMIHSLGNKE